MGKSSPTAADNATVQAGTFTSAVPSPGFDMLAGKFNLSIWGTFAATVSIERSFDGGVTWLNASRDSIGTPNAFTSALSVICEEIEQDMQYRLNCTSYTSGTVNWRISR